MSLPTTYSWILTTAGPVGVGSAQGGNAGNRTSGDGKTGLSLPVAADGRGRFSLVSGNQQLEKIILLNLSDLESDNPFQEPDLGLGADLVFAVASEKLQADVKRRINSLFRRLQLQDRARLQNQLQFIQDSANQEMTVDVKYINLEENKPGTLGLKFSLVNSTT